MNNIILFEDVQQIASIQEKTEERRELSECLDEITSTEEGAGKLLRCIIDDYGIKDTLLSLFPFLSDDEQSRLMKKAFPAM